MNHKDTEPGFHKAATKLTKSILMIAEPPLWRQQSCQKRTFLALAFGLHKEESEHNCGSKVPILRKGSEIQHLDSKIETQRSLWLSAASYGHFAFNDFQTVRNSDSAFGIGSAQLDPSQTTRPPCETESQKLDRTAWDFWDMNSKALRFHEGFLCGLASFMKNSAEVSAFLASLRLFYFASEWEMNQSPCLCRTLRRMWQNPSVFLIRPSIFAKIADSTHSCTANPEWEPIDFPIVPPSSFPLPDLKIQSRLQVMYSHTFAAPWTLSSFLFAPGIHNALLNLPLFFAHALPASLSHWMLSIKSIHSNCLDFSPPVLPMLSFQLWGIEIIRAIP